MTGSYRSTFEERDLSGYISASTDETGAMVINSSKGPKVPIKCSSEEEVLTYFGYPSALYPEVFEALAFCTQSPCWISSAIGTGALSGGVDVKASSVVAFSVGRNYDTYVHAGPDITQVSHTFYSYSPCDDELAVKIENVTGSRFKLTLYSIVSGVYVYINEYTYSLIREKDAFGKQLYIDDIFLNNKYIKANLNTSYTGSIPTLTPATVDFNGGLRGATPNASQYNASWDYFKKPNKYSAKIFMDTSGQSPVYIKNIIETYQYYAHGIFVIPFGQSDSVSALSYKTGLGIDSDNVSLYCNWRKIYDTYNDSYAWISNIGCIGKKYAQMESIYDGLSPAGIDENGYGGQIGDYQTIEMEEDYDDTDLQDLDEANINPVIFDDNYGTMIYGDKTMQATSSDTSFIHTRRIYNYIIEKIVKNVLRLQEFKNNDSSHRLKAKSMTETFLNPIIARELLSARVICDTTNNTAEVLEQRQFILDVIVQATPNSQKCRLRITRISQNQVLADVVPV